MRPVRDRAIRRAGELLKQIEPATGKNNQYAQVKGGDAPTLHSRKQAASDAGMSRDQMHTALRVANIPTAELEAQVESANPPTVTALAEQGKRPTSSLPNLVSDTGEEGSTAKADQDHQGDDGLSIEPCVSKPGGTFRLIDVNVYFTIQLPPPKLEFSA